MSTNEASARVILLLASDRVAAGEREDATAAGLEPLLADAGLELSEVLAVPDERATLAAALREALTRARFVLTSGGTGLGPRDVTPEATRDVLERELPGFGEAMRAVSRAKLPTADISRALAGSVGDGLVVNLPGSPRGAAECLAAVLPASLHALRLLAGQVRDCADELGLEPPPSTHG
ncbi:MAG: molybdenum cofactor biosynthesis protein [Planctomycetota bacterium]|nr:MAG: molybdenum cofactor biosynthesis protein [Planctomycetota bacterium]